MILIKIEKSYNGEAGRSLAPDLRTLEINLKAGMQALLKDNKMILAVCIL